jgi:hypothetical protein
MDDKEIAELIRQVDLKTYERGRKGRGCKTGEVSDKDVDCPYAFR